MPFMRLVRVIPASIACLFLLAGCWDRVEIDELAMIMGTGVDKADNGRLEATVQIASPTGIQSFGSAGSNRPPFHVLTEQGKDGLDVMNRLQEQLSRSFFLGHRAVFIIGEKYARQGVDQTLSQLMRSPDSRYSSYILTTFGSTAKEVLSTPYSLELIPAIAIKKMQHEDYSLGVRIDEFLDALATEGKVTITGAIRIVHNGGGKAKTLRIDKAAVYHNNKLAAFLNETEVKLLLWEKEKLKGWTMTANIEPQTKPYKGTVGVRFLKSSSSIRTMIVNGKPSASLHFRGTVKILSNDSSLDVSKPDVLRLVEQTFESQALRSLTKMIDRSQKEYKADIFDVGEAVHIRHPAYWKSNKANWKEIYPSIPIDVSVSLKVESTGRTHQPVQVLE